MEEEFRAADVGLTGGRELRRGKKRPKREGEARAEPNSPGGSAGSSPSRIESNHARGLSAYFFSIPAILSPNFCSAALNSARVSSGITIEVGPRRSPSKSRVSGC